MDIERPIDLRLPVRDPQLAPMPLAPSFVHARSARGADRAPEDVSSQSSFFHSMIWR